MIVDASATSWVPVPDGSDFPIQNLPYGVFADAAGIRCGIAIGESVFDLARAEVDRESFARRRDLVVDHAVRLRLPVAVGDYVDFYSSEQHATNVGRMFCPDAEALVENWKHLPVGYHGRSGTILPPAPGACSHRERSQAQQPTARPPFRGDKRTK